MQSALKLTARVPLGHRVEFTAPELPENTDVELIVMLPHSNGNRLAAGEPEGVWDYIRSLPPVDRTPEEWAEVERELREEKDSWDR
jgi:hypothetical protein